MVHQSKGKKGRKYGRAARRPSTGRRKSARRDIVRHARNVSRSAKGHAERELRVWAESAIKRGEPIGIVVKARDAFMPRKAAS